MGEDPEDICGVVEGEVSKPHAEDDQVMRKPANKKESSNNDDHFGDLTLGSPGL